MNGAASRAVASSQSQLPSTPGGSGDLSVVRRRLGAVPAPIFSAVAVEGQNSTPPATRVEMRSAQAAA